MNLTNEERNALVSIRMQKAKDTLLETKGILGLGYWRAAANRLYYACFYAASALLMNRKTLYRYSHQPKSILSL